MNWLDFPGLLAAKKQNVAPINWFVVTKFIIVLAVMFVMAIVRRVGESRDRAKRSKNPPKLPSSPTSPGRKDNPLRSEIEAFLEEVGKRRSGEGAARPASTQAADTTAVNLSQAASARAESARKTVVLRPIAPADRKKFESGKGALANTAPQSQSPPTRPGDDIATRKSPVSQDLGKQIRARLSQQQREGSRLTAQAHSDLGNAVADNLRQRVGVTLTHGTEVQEQQIDNTQMSKIALMLRNSSDVRNAIVINEILGRPKALRRSR